MKVHVKLLIASVLTVLVLACNQHDNPLAYQEDSHSRGKAVILIEESFKRLFDTSIYTFESQYPKADIVPTYMAESDIIEAFYQNKAKTIVISRDFTEDEKKSLKTKKVEVRSDKIAIDAVALIVHPSNTDTMLTVAQLKDLLTGKTKNWMQNKKPVTIVFDQQSSANYHYLKEFCGQDIDSKNVFAVKSNEEVINYVKKNPSAMGVIGLNWISDQDDFDVKDFLADIKVVALAEKEGGKYFQPYAGFMWTKEYPLTRDIWMINKARKAGLHTGFVLFMCGEIGQTIINQSALVPAKNPVRLIQMIEE